MWKYSPLWSPGELHRVSAASHRVHAGMCISPRQEKDVWWTFLGWLSSLCFPLLTHSCSLSTVLSRCIFHSPSSSFSWHIPALATHPVRVCVCVFVGHVFDGSTRRMYVTFLPEQPCYHLTAQEICEETLIQRRFATLLLYCTVRTTKLTTTVWVCERGTTNTSDNETNKQTSSSTMIKSDSLQFQYVTF